MKRFAVFALVFALGFAACWLYRDTASEQHAPTRGGYPVRVSIHHFQHLDRPAEVADIISVEDRGTTNRIGDQNAEGKRVRIDLTYSDRTVALFGVER